MKCQTPCFQKIREISPICHLLNVSRDFNKKKEFGDYQWNIVAFFLSSVSMKKTLHKVEEERNANK